MAYEHLADTLAKLPPTPGVYLMKDRKGDVLYVGKAVSLRSRVRTYFQPSATPHTPMIAMMLPRVQEIEVLHTRSAVDALVLENNLVKQHQPRYNIKLKDDKRYPYVKVSTSEPFPRISVTRVMKPDGDAYFGPFVHAKATRATLKQLTRMFPIRTCSLDLAESGNDYRVCLDFHIGRCPGPCANLITKDDYAEIVHGVEMFLGGRTKELLNGLKTQMQEAAAALNFEKAAKLRDRIEQVLRGTEQQSMDSMNGEDYDAIGCAVRGTIACAHVLMVRDGKLVEREHFFLTDVEGVDATAVLSAFVPQYYAEASFVPGTVVLQDDIDMATAVREWLQEKRRSSVTLFIPKRGPRRDMVELAARNAATILEQRAANVVASADENPALQELMEMLNLDHLPHRIEAFDISNFGERIIVGSMVVFEDGMPARSEYRRFRVRDLEGQDDFAAMKQVIHRRFTRGLREGTPMPHLILIDGGKGQLNAATEALVEAEYDQQPRIGLAKRYEHIFLPGQTDPIILRRDHPTLHLIQHCRDEAHRFAVSYLRRLRGQRITASVLDEIPNVGDKRKQALLQHFGSVDAIRDASLDDLLSVRSITRPVAQRIFKHLHTRAEA